MSPRGEPVSLEQFFAERDPHSRVLFDLLREVVKQAGESEMRVTKSQVAWRRRNSFAWAWIPGQYLKGNRDLAPLVLTLDLPRHDESSRWKQVVEPRPGRFTHHMELRSAEQLDGEVLGWIREAWEWAG